MAGLPCPAPREQQMMADLIDAIGYGNAGRKWKPYPRPWVAAVEKKRMGNVTGMSPDQVRALLAETGPQRQE